ncbi:ATP-dependent DNA helicase RecG [Pseudactinotalea suaedae]|uniref:ATP-dependent DNA helicase RecG n=1 Tax=Pseudactinotalea suaedae TaxID=1524924 RepID=UPI001F503B71|nr:ATP-dependent DNA helicase RecG [Pseudactinotalea suaedae]
MARVSGHKAKAIGARSPLGRRFGERTGVELAKLGLETEEDLLRHYPRRYVERGACTPLDVGTPGEPVTYIAEVVHLTKRFARDRRMQIISVTISDGTSTLPLTFFARQAYLASHLERQLKVGTVAMFAGTLKQGLHGQRELTHPEVEPLDSWDDEETARREAGRPVPIYGATTKLPSWKIRDAIRTVLDPLTEAEVLDPVPAEIVSRRGLMSELAALRAIHMPEDKRDSSRARHRLRYDEAFLLQTALARRRADLAAFDAQPRPAVEGGLVTAFDAQLPFTLTDGQVAVAGEIGADLAAAAPMQRLLQGEVGSGKTVVALRAMLQVVDNGGQAALLAPTEVLAHQHARTIRALLGPLGEAGMLGGSSEGTRVALLTGSLGAAARKAALLQAASGEAGIVVGTHALLGERVQFADLGLVVVDEQHRFGVEQRDALRAKGKVMPHQLYMTATPIPRSVAMTFFGDVEVSTLREIPAGRSPIATHVVPAGNARWMERVWSKVAEEIDGGGRVYVVAPRISSTQEEEGVDVDASLTGEGEQKRSPGATELVDGGPDSTANVEDAAAWLRRFSGLDPAAIGVMHGRLTTEEKDAAMAAFAWGAVPVLVSTTVIEVGVDVPEATMMVVLDADRFGLSQLHQLRGRVGRGSKPGTCLVVSWTEAGSSSQERLTILAETLDGFRLAEADLEQRREGDILGAAQSGRATSLRLLRVIADADIIEQARADARELISEDPNLAHHPELLIAITQLVDPDHEEFLDRV